MEMALMSEISHSSATLLKHSNSSHRKRCFVRDGRSKYDACQNPQICIRLSEEISWAIRPGFKSLPVGGHRSTCGAESGITSSAAWLPRQLPAPNEAA